MQPDDIPRAAPKAVVIYGQERENQSLADELTLDGYSVRLTSDLAMLGGVELVIFGRAEHRGAGLDALRAGQLAGGLGARVLWMSTSGEAVDVIRAFDAGADDVIRAPFVYAELLARVRALLRRDVSALTPAVIRYSALEIDTAARTATFGSTPVILRRREYALLVHLGREPTRVFTKDELLQEVWGYHSLGATRTVDSHASRLRRSLARAGAEGWVSANWGVGYSLQPR